MCAFEKQNTRQSWKLKLNINILSIFQVQWCNKNFPEDLSQQRCEFAVKKRAMRVRLKA